MGWILMAFALIANLGYNSGSGNGGTSGTLDSTGANLIVVTVSSYQTNAEPTLSDSKGNTYTGITAYSVSGSTRQRHFYVLNPTVGSSHTFTLSGTNSFPSLCVSCWSGAHASSVLDQQTGNTTASGTTVAPGSVTPSEDNCLVIVGYGAETHVGTHSINGGFTESNETSNAGGFNFKSAMSYLIQTTAAAANPTCTSSATDKLAAGIVSFKAAGAAGFLAPRPKVISQAVGNAMSI